MKSSFAAWSWIVVSSVGQLVAAQDPSSARSITLDPSIELEFWSREDGLPQDSVTAIEATRDGYLWVGTFGGLARFDGVRFQSHTIANSPGLPSNRILTLFEDRTRRLWVGTEHHGVARLEGGRFVSHPETATFGFVSDVAEDRDGQLWFATGRGLARRRDGPIELVNVPDAVAGAGVLDLEVDSSGTVWAAVRGGILRLHGDRTELVQKTSFYGSIECLVAVGDRLWGLSPNAIGIVNAEGFTPVKKFGFGAVHDVHVDATGVLLVGASEFHALRIVEKGGRPKVVRALEVEMGFDGVNRAIRSFRRDDEGNLWIGSNGSGLARASLAEHVKIGLVHGLVGSVRNVAAAPSGIWMEAKNQSLYRWDGSAVTATQLIPTRHRQPPNTDLVGVDVDGSLWVTDYNQLWHLVEPVERFPVNVQVGSFARDRDGAAWFSGIDGALMALRDGEWATHRIDGIALVERVQLIDRDGATWFSFRGGLGRLSEAGTDLFRVADSAVGAELRDVVEGPDGSLWITTYGDGLLRWRQGEGFVRFGYEVGLQDVSLGGLLLVDERLWINSNSGVMLVSLAELDAVAAGRSARVSCRLLRTGEGNQGAAAIDGEGRMWFPTVDGIAVVDPERLRRDLLPPRCYIEAVTADQVAYPMADRIDVPPGSGNLEIAYTGLSFAAPKQISFRYRLVGYDDAWVEAGKRRTAYFTQVPPGNYTFEVVARNADGIPGPAAAAFQVRLRPRLYQTGWFLWFCGLATVGLVLTWNRARVRRVQRHNLALRHEIVERERAENERRKLEDSLRESKRLEAVGRLAGGIAHDFNNVLTAILGRSALLSRIPEVAEAPVLRQHLDSVVECAQRAAALTYQLLAFSRQQVLQPRVFDPRAIVDGLETMLQPLLPDNVRLTICHAAEIGVVRVDPTRFEQVVVNLVLNARDAMPEGGAILLETSMVTLTDEHVAAHAAARVGQHVVLSVTDDGDGIAEHVLPHVFEPFYSTKDRAKGTGLGLASVHGIVTQSGGHVMVSSEVGVGTVFRVHLPVATGDVDYVLPARAPVAHRQVLGSETLLVCEDDDAIRQTAAAILRSHGFQVMVAARPSQAFELAAGGERIDLLITDVVMPEMNGQDLAVALNAERPELRVLYVSGYLPNESIQREVAEHSVHFLDKPFTETQLLEKIAEVLAAPTPRAADPRTTGR